MIAQRRAAHADAAPRPVTSASRKASARSGRSAYLAPSFESWFHSARLTAVATHECVCDYRLRKRQMHRGVATVMFRVICQSRGGRSDPLGRRLLAAAGVRRCRRPEARPLPDLSDFHPADLSDFRPPLTSDVAAGASTLRTLGRLELEARTCPMAIERYTTGLVRERRQRLIRTARPRLREFKRHPSEGVEHTLQQLRGRLDGESKRHSLINPRCQSCY